MGGDIPKGAMLKGLENQMYQDYKVSEYAAGRTPALFEDWKKTLEHSRPVIPRNESNIEYGFPEKRRKRDSKAVNEKLNEIWGEANMENKNTFVCTKCNKEKSVVDFYKNKSERGHEAWCKDCKKENQKKRQQNQTKSRPKKVIKKTEKVEQKKVVPKEVKKDIVPGSTTQNETYTLTREELLEFGRAAFEKGRNYTQTLSKDTKESLLDEICCEKAS